MPPHMNDAPHDAYDVSKVVSDNGIEFLFAQFVDMHGKPSAKLVPAHNLDDLLTEGAGFAGFAAGDIGQGPDDPDMDRAIFFRYMVESLAQQRGLIATFMPKPFAHLTGNGCHFHVSLWKDGENKRLIVGAPSSGATWAPAYVSYGYNNRTQMLRVPAPGRIEDRTVDGSCNPHLAATAMLTAGLDGIERGLDPGDPNSANRLGAQALPAAVLSCAIWRQYMAGKSLSRALRSAAGRAAVPPHRAATRPSAGCARRGGRPAR
jgi:glutamine synthetase